MLVPDKSKCKSRGDGVAWMGIGEEIIQYGKLLSLAGADVMQKRVGER